jgi:CBS domain-containing protein
MFIGIILLISYFAEASGIHGAIGALLLGVLFAQIPKKDYEQEVDGLRKMANGIFIPIFFAGIGIYFSFGFLSLPSYLIAAVLAVVTFGKFAGSILAAAIAKLRPILAVGTGVMAKGAIDLALLLSLLSIGLIKPDLFSLVVFGIVVMTLASSATLKRGFSLKSSSASEVTKSVSLETASDSLSPLYARTVLGELRVRSVHVEDPPTVYGETSIRELADKHREHHNPAYVAVTRQGSYLGIVTPEQFHKIRRENWSEAIVNDISLQHIRAVKMDDYLYDVVEYMALHDLDLVAVVTDDDMRVIGGVMRKNILDHLSKV